MLPDGKVNPFYLKLGTIEGDDSYGILLRDDVGQILLMVKGHKVELFSSKQLGITGSQKIEYFKETPRFPAGTKLDHRGGGLVVVLSGGEVLWVYYHWGWKVYRPE